MDDRTVARLTVEHLMKILPAGLHGLLEPYWEPGCLEQPDLIDRPNSGMRHYRARVLPPARKRTPHKFWNPSWCFYEMGVGVYGGLDRCRVQFLMAGNQKVCSSGRYNQAVDDILRAAARKRGDAEHKSISSNPYAHLWIRARVPDPEQMARDMVWIIENTMSALINIPEAGVG